MESWVWRGVGDRRRWAFLEQMEQLHSMILRDGSVSGRDLKA